jgi:cation transport ATPase
MIHIGVWLIVGGILGAAMRDRQQIKPTSTKLAKPEPIDDTSIPVHSYDDVGELQHYQKISLYSFAVSASGSLFYPPVALVSAPLLGYSAYNYFKTARQSGHWKRSPGMATFEVVGIMGSMLTGRLFIASTVTLLAFSARNLLLQAGNIANNLSPTDSLRFKDSSVWILRDGAEVEIKIHEIRSGDIVIVHENDTIMLEGRVVEGEGQVRQFSLDKKMKLINKAVGDSVYPYTKLSQGYLHIDCKSAKHD